MKTTDIFLFSKNSSKNLPNAASLVSRHTPSNQHQHRIGVPAGSWFMYWLHTNKSTRGEIDVN